MKLKRSSDFSVWLPVSKASVKIHLEYFSTFVSVTIHRVGWSLPAVLDLHIKNKYFRDEVSFYDVLLQKFD